MMNKPAKPAEKIRYVDREAATGRFSFSGGFERFCVCGHRFGVHTGGDAPHECLNGDSGCPGATGEPCDCLRFKPVDLKPAQYAILKAMIEGRQVKQPAPTMKVLARYGFVWRRTEQDPWAVTPNGREETDRFAEGLANLAKPRTPDIVLSK